MLFCFFLFAGKASAQKVSYIPLPPWADTAYGIILNAHINFSSSGTCLYDSLGRLIRVEKGKCSLIEFVYDKGRWLPYYQKCYKEIKP